MGLIDPVRQSCTHEIRRGADLGSRAPPIRDLVSPIRKDTVLLVNDSVVPVQIYIECIYRTTLGIHLRSDNPRKLRRNSLPVPSAPSKKPEL
jgi:hypothetical protein